MSSGTRIVNTHNDSVHLELKPRPFRESADIALLDTIVHGSLKNYQWVNRPLALIGRVIRSDGTSVRVDIGHAPADPVLIIPDLPPHTDADFLQRTTRTVIQAEELDPERKHAQVAVHEAFDIARRQLQDYARRQRGDVKTAARQPRGRVSRLFPIDEFGYIEAEEGHEVYFQKSSVLRNAFDRLAVGSEVSFVEEPGEKGPQASTVKLLHPRR